MSERTVYTIGELAERTGVERDALDRWLETGLVRPDGKGPTGVPFFSETVIERIGHIRSFLHMGYGEEEIEKILRKVGPPEASRRGEGRSGAENLLTVGALAESVGVSPRTIKHWEDKGIIEADARSEGGFRLYQEHYVYLCHLIQDLQLFGYSLDQIKQISDYFRDFVVLRDDLSGYPAEETDRKLGEMLGEIDKLFQKTTQLRNGIERWEKLLNKHKKIIIDLKRRNEKRMTEETE
ncbi:MAG: MerR family transcriptional regulator [Spirochaetaceae bacterium]